MFSELVGGRFSFTVDVLLCKSILCLQLWESIDVADQNVHHKGVNVIYIHGMAMLQTWLMVIDSHRAYSMYELMCNAGHYNVKIALSCMNKIFEMQYDFNAKGP